MPRPEAAPQNLVPQVPAPVVRKANEMPAACKHSSHVGSSLLAGLALMLAAVPAVAQEREAYSACDELRPAQITAETVGLLLADTGDIERLDGTPVRLADIRFADLLPDLPDVTRAELRATRHGMLAALFSARPLFACSLGAGPDRYGRLPVDAFDPQDPFSLRRHLVAEGLALVHPRTRTDTCCAALYRAEASARRAGRGVWDGAPGLIRKIDRRTGSTVLPLSDFAIVEGRILSVGDREKDLYLNFGRRWSTDFTVVIAKTGFSGTERDLERLAGLTGKRIRVRGVSDAWQGGRIRVTDPDQIEILTP